MTQTIDFTKMRKGTRTRGTRKIEICPNCGRKGERVNYSKGEAGVTHKLEYRGVLPEATDFCLLPKAEVAS